MKKIDMSEKAILQRLKTVDRLRELCLVLMKNKKTDQRLAGVKSDKKAVGKAFEKV